MNHLDKVRKWIGNAGPGVEIGAFRTPIPGISPWYVDCFEEYAGERCLLDYKGDACHLPFVDNSLAYVASSHVLEHVANPILALEEWARVLRPGGIIYMVIPDKRFTWDRLRATTTIDHLLDDFKRGTTQSDATHVNEFIDGVVWAEYGPGKTEEEKESYRHLLLESVKAKLEINIHFHVFEPAYFPTIIDRINSTGCIGAQLHLLEIVERFPEAVPNGFLVALRLRKPGLNHRLAALRNRGLKIVAPKRLVKRGERHLRRSS